MPMSFASILQEIVDECGGGLAAALMGSDGIPIDQVEASGEVREIPGHGIEVLGVEFGRILDEMRKASDSVGGGALEEVSVRLANFWVLMRVVDEETYLVLAIEPGGNAGKARFLMRRQLLALREEL
jgi:predicted regulator of Ras-like GTPase activity (Roadblock/LC7/MglB family)